MALLKSRRGFFGVGFAIALAYVAAWYAVPAEGRWIYDTALKTVQVRAIVERGSFDLAWPGREIDPDFEFGPIARGFHTRIGDELHAAYSPVFPLLSTPFVMAFGAQGYGVLPLLGAALTMFGVFRLARRVAGEDLCLAWLAAALSLLATPLWFYAFTFWEHTLAVGFACFAVEACLLFRERLDLANALRVGVLVALPIYLRPEHYLFALVVLGFAAWPARHDLRVVVAMALAVVAALLPLWGFHVSQFGHPLGPHITSQPWGDVGFSQYLAERGAVASRLLFNLHATTALSLAVGAPFYLLLVAQFTGWVERERGSMFVLASSLAGLLAAAVVAYGYADAARPMNWMIAANGLFAGSPLLILAFLAIQDENDGFTSARRVLLAIVVVYAALYTAFIPEVNSRGIHWGNRFLLSVYPLLAVLAAATIRELFEEGRSRWPARVAVVALVIATMGLQIYSLAMLRERKVFVAALNQAVRESEARVVASDTWFVPVDLSEVWFEKSLFLAPAPRREAFRARLREADPQRVLYVDRAGSGEPGGNAKILDDGWLGFCRVSLREEGVGPTNRRRR